MDSFWKESFDILMMISCCYNIFINAYYSVFGPPTSTAEIAIDYAIEVLFFFDMMFNFCQEYMDDETFKVIRVFTKIAHHYAKKSFLFDFIAWFPIESCVKLISGNQNIQKERLFRMLKLLRIPRLFQLLNVEKFKE